METLQKNNNGYNNTSRKRRKFFLLITTSHPSATITTTTNSGGSLVIVCPYTGTIHSSTRIQGGDLNNNSNNKAGCQVGVTTLSIFPKLNNNNNNSSSSRLAIGYGINNNGNSKRRTDDTYGMLFTIRNLGNSPILHWKCRLPESDMTSGLLISPVTSRHVIGGGKSGTLFVWDVLHGGKLIRTIRSAHYRAITCMIWSSCQNTDSTLSSCWNCHLITGGADGMVHVFSHIDLVEEEENTDSKIVQPIRTWTKHHLAVTALSTLPGGRIVSTSDDGQIIIMEICSNTIIATIQCTDSIQSLCSDNSGNRLYAGSIKGIIYIIDLNEYALHKTKQMGATIIHIVQSNNNNNQQQQTITDQIFGDGRVSSNDNNNNNKSDNESSSSSYNIMELRGHDKSITSINVIDDDILLVSGDENGTLRIWDIQRLCCIRIIQPWSSMSSISSSSINNNTKDSTTKDKSSKSGTSSNSSNNKGINPVTSIHILSEDDDDDIFGVSAESTNTNHGGMMMFAPAAENKKKKVNNVLTGMVSPLQKFVSTTSTTNNNDTYEVAVPFIEPKREIIRNNYARSNRPILRLEEIVKKQEIMKRKRMNSTMTTNNQSVNKTQKIMTNSNNNNNNVMNDNDDSASSKDGQVETTIEQLRKELNEAKATIERWEIVNNKLMSKLRDNTK